MHEVSARRKRYKAKGKNILHSLDQEYLKRLSTKLDGTKYGLKKKKKSKKKKTPRGSNSGKLIYDKFSRPRKHQKAITEDRL